MPSLNDDEMRTVRGDDRLNRSETDDDQDDQDTDADDADTTDSDSADPS